MHSFSVTEAWWKNRFFELNDGLCIELVIATKNVINVMIIIKLTIEKKKIDITCSGFREPLQRHE